MVNANGFMLFVMFTCIFSLLVFIFILACLYQIVYELKKGNGAEDLEKFKPNRNMLFSWLVCFAVSITLCALVMFTGMR